MPKRHVGPTITVEDHEIKKSTLDKRSYRVIELPNKLEVVLVHEPNADVVGAAMTVRVGAASDPKDMPGMAHAVEHMLCHNRPKNDTKGDSWFSAVNGYGGLATANTTHDRTFYYFLIPQAATPSDLRADLSADGSQDEPWSQMLSYFASSFTGPRFKKDLYERQIRAIDSENQGRGTSDSVRRLNLELSLTNPAHPHSHPRYCGNCHTLYLDPRSRGHVPIERLKAWHKETYSADRMHLVLLGSRSLDELQAHAVKLFSAVPNREYGPLSWKPIPLWRPKEDLGRIIYFESIQEERSLMIRFPMRDVENYYKSRPHRVMAYALESQSAGSLFEYLKNREWCTTLDWCIQEPADYMPGIARFEIAVSLTEAGLRHYRDVFAAICASIGKMAACPSKVKQKLFQGEKSLRQMHFPFERPPSAFSLLENIGENLVQNIRRDRLLGPLDDYTDFDAAAVDDFFAALTPDNALLTLSSPPRELPVTTNRTERGYNTRYRYDRLAPDFRAKLYQSMELGRSGRTEMTIPPANKYIPRSFAIMPPAGVPPRSDYIDSQTPPEILRHEKHLRVWWKPHYRYPEPRSLYSLLFRSDVANATEHNRVLTRFWISLVSHVLEDDYASAASDGLHWSIENTPAGLNLDIHGYSDKIDLFLQEVLQRIVFFNFGDTEFEHVKGPVEAFWHQQHFMSPLDMATKVWLPRIFVKPTSSLNEKIGIVAGLTSNEMRRFHKRLFARLFTEIIVYGNVDIKGCLRVSQVIEKQLQDSEYLPVSQWPIERSLDLSAERTEYVFKTRAASETATENAIVCYFYLGPDSAKPNFAAALLFNVIFATPFFDELRTKQGLGYRVKSDLRWGTGDNGDKWQHWVLMQGPEDVDYLEEQIESFITDYEQKLRSLERADFEQYKRGLMALLQLRPKTPEERVERLFHPIMSQGLNFELRLKLVEQVRALTRADILRYYRTYIKSGGESRVKATVQVLGKKARDEVDTPARHELLREKREARLGLDDITRVKIGNIAAFHASRRLNPAVETFSAMQQFVDADSRYGGSSWRGDSSASSAASGASSGRSVGSRDDRNGNTENRRAKAGVRWEQPEMESRGSKSIRGDQNGVTDRSGDSNRSYSGSRSGRSDRSRESGRSSLTSISKGRPLQDTRGSNSRSPYDGRSDADAESKMKRANKPRGERNRVYSDEDEDEDEYGDEDEDEHWDQDVDVKESTKNESRRRARPLLSFRNRPNHGDDWESGAGIVPKTSSRPADDDEINDSRPKSVIRATSKPTPDSKHARRRDETTERRRYQNVQFRRTP